MQQQTTYAQARSRDPRNQIYGQGNTYVDPRAVNPFIQRPGQSSNAVGNPAAMLTPPSQNWRGSDLSNVQPPAPAGLEQLAQQAQQDNQTMTQQPDMLQRAQALLANRGQGGPLQSNGGLAGIEVPATEQGGAALSSLGTEEGLEDAGLTPRLPTTQPEPITKDDKTFTQPAVDASKNAVSTLFHAQSANQGVAGATAKKDQERINNDMQKIAESKNPHAAWQDLKKEPFYQNSSFYTGLMGVGLSIMSGRDPLEAFQIGSQMADQDSMKQQLSANRDALLDQGYSADSVAQAVAQGDPRFLKMKQMSQEDQAAAEDQRWQQRYDIQRQDQLADQETAGALALQRDKARDERAQRNADLVEQRQKNLIDYRNQIKQEAAKQASQSFDFGSRDINAEKNTPEGSNIKQWSTKKGYFTAADKEHELAQDAISRYNKSKSEGDRQEATAAFKQLIFNLARGEIGENRSLQGSDLAEFAEDPSIPIRTINDIKLKAGFTPTLDALRYVKKGIDIGIKSMDYNIDKTKEQRIRANAVTLGPRKATALVNRAFGGGFHDPLNAFDTEAQEAGVNVVGSGGLRGGALSGSYDEDPSWMQDQ